MNYIKVQVLEQPSICIWKAGCNPRIRYEDKKVGADLPERFMDIWYRLSEQDRVLCVAERREVPYE